MLVRGSFNSNILSVSGGQCVRQWVALFVVPSTRKPTRAWLMPGADGFLNHHEKAGLNSWTPIRSNPFVSTERSSVPRTTEGYDTDGESMPYPYKLKRDYCSNHLSPPRFRERSHSALAVCKEASRRLPICPRLNDGLTAASEEESWHRFYAVEPI